MLVSVRFAGMGGQGVIFSGIALARAAALYEGGSSREIYSVQTQAYGPEARGGSSKSDVKISDREEFYPFVNTPDFLIVMSQPAYERYIESTRKETVVFLDEGSVESRPSLHYYEVPATGKAEEISKRIVANVVMLGAFVEISEVVSKRAVLSALADISPKGTEGLNRRAYELGVALGQELKE